MFTIGRPAAIAASLAMAGALLVGPQGVAASDTDVPLAWGLNHHGQLGDASATNSIEPVLVDTAGALAGKTVTAVRAGSYHSCALADGKAYCWGDNQVGQLGTGSTTDSSVPVAVDTSGVLAGKTVTAVSAGGWRTCVVADGSPYCWGSGSLGDSTSMQSTVPVAVDTSGALAGKSVTAISTGAGHTCVIADAQPYCWGAGASAVYDYLPKSLVPAAVDTSGKLTGKTVTAISAGSDHACAIAGGRAYCWGSNSRGGLGNNSTAGSTVPVPVDASGALRKKTVTAIAANWGTTCAIADGRAYCWGDNQWGALGKPGISRSKVPVAVDTRGSMNQDPVTAITVSGVTTCSVAGGRAYCWGDAGEVLDSGMGPWWVASQVPVLVDTGRVLPGRAIAAISAGAGHVLALTGAAPPPTYAIVGLKAKASKATVRISWRGVSGASGYRVRISRPGGKSFRAWKGTTRTSYSARVKRGAKYRVQVAALGPAGRGPVATTTVRVQRS